MIIITNREAVQDPDSITALFTGAEHQADISFFWVDAPPGEGQQFHWHPYAETWVVLEGEALIDTQDEDTKQAHPGDIVTVSAETIHRYRAGGKKNLRMICIHPSPKVEEVFI